MKKVCLFLSLLIFAACSNNTHTSTNGESGPNRTHVENVNGNMPDTTGGSVLNGSPVQDSSKAKK